MLSGTPFTLADLRAAYDAGATAADVVREVYRRIEAVNDPGIFIHLPAEAEVIAAAEALGPRDGRPLWGIPFVVKDNIDVADMPTTSACPAVERVADADAFVVARLKAAGAIVVGKTNLDQFATGLVGVRSPYPVPKNAVDPAIVPGGSSSGSAVAVGHGIVPFSLGTDTAGSGRVPAALNNIVGLKPSLGALSATGMMPACRTVDTISIFALTVADAHEVFRLAAAYDPADAWSRPVAAPPPSAPPKPRVAIPDAASIEFFGDTVQAENFATTVAALEQSGAVITEIDLTPFFQVAEMLYYGAFVAERHTVIEPLLASRPDAVHPVTREVVEKALGFTATDAFRDIYRLAELRRVVEPVVANVDLILVPTIPTFYSVADLEADPIGPNSRLGTYTNFVNLLDMCGLAVPTLPRGDGRPGSVTLLAPHGRDGLLAGVARTIEQFGSRTLGATGAPVPPPVPLAEQAVDGEIELAVCGAHMSGMALNGELTSRGGRYLRTVDTTSEYGLYALPGGPPFRPGLVRIGDRGGAVSVEVWALPLAEVGGFLAGIPAPLGLGTTRLADGTTPKGFVCEAIATADAQDVTAYGSWRAFTAARLAS
ncbi:allophanate hydrolase [Acuticoccus sediminis]|uniref:Allophanate hydrolase n=1 Tax=Acuticoccus sediminis TaxID=2184697 RepID=A0A8B2NY82_9HYPH|nr:allophanate hydrolase [Acuticoccus sediminis]RAI01560.1 allophanate hydrolase [Acuticoccus sediminis]